MKNLPGPLVRILLLAAAVAAGWGLLSVFGFFQPDLAEQIQIGQQALANGDAALAESTALSVIDEDPEKYEAWVIAAVAAAAREDYETAQERFDTVPDDESLAAVQARLRCGDMLLNKVQRLSDAEKQFRRAYQQQKAPRLGVEQLALLLGIGSRYHEQIPFLLEVIRDENFNNLHLYLVQEGRNKPVNTDSIPVFMKNVPDDPAPQLAQAQQEILVGNADEAIPILRRIIKSHPEMAEAHAKLGLALLSDGRRDDLADWARQLPSNAKKHPDAWIVRGEFSELLSRKPAAIRCYWEAVRRDPNNQKSCLSLARLLSEVGEAEAAAEFNQRAEKLKVFSEQIEMTQSTRDSGNSQENAAQAEALGLLWEAFGWTHMGLRLDSRSRWANDNILRLRKATKDLPLVRTAPGMNPAEKFDLSRFPLPDEAS